MDFLLYLIDKENEDILWQTWLSKETGKDFKELKKEYLKPLRLKKGRAEKGGNLEENLKFASQFINVRKVAMDGSI
ncbi:hypothetical protein COC69_05725 [Bacillus cereus]|uniref:Uncharacterized protein n=2 Tax=Bacillus cereus TaxID=1396 RepID=A0A9X7CRD2_BACCE|nr:hypothetical protein COC69_05725 [Bacillus cereus]